jgi:hypothetical protein
MPDVDVAQRREAMVATAAVGSTPQRIRADDARPFLSTVTKAIR